VGDLLQLQYRQILANNNAPVIEGFVV